MSIKFRGKTKVGFTVDLPFEAFTYPAGEAEIKVTGDFDPEQYEYFIADVRAYDSHTLFHLAMFSELVDGYGIDWNLFLPYIPGARADRGKPFGAKVYAEFILNLEPHHIVVLDPHSPVSTTLLSRLEAYGTKLDVFPVERIIKREVQDGSSDSRPQPYAGVIAPDKGAHDRASAAAHVMGVPVYYGGKTRDFSTGKLSGFHMEDELPAEGKFLIVDDICDGGGTFVGLAEATGLPKERLDLWVTHGVFSKGLGALYNNFGVIHTTTSYFGNSKKDLDLWKFEEEAGRLDVHDVTPYLYEALHV
jgi:ribose-phosphate pyrophosphokinase